MSKIENLYQKLTGVDPRLLQPPLTGQALFKELSVLRRGISRTGEDLFNKPHVTKFAVVESGKHDVSHEIYTIVRRTLSDGREQLTFVHGRSIGYEELIGEASEIADDLWFSLEDFQK